MAAWAGLCPVLFKPIPCRPVPCVRAPWAAMPLPWEDEIMAPSSARQHHPQQNFLACKVAEKCAMHRQPFLSPPGSPVPIQGYQLPSSLRSC